LNKLHPRNLAAAFAAIDAEAQAERARQPGAERRAAVALLTVAVCLLMIHYLKFETSFEAFLDWVGQQTGDTGFTRVLRHGRWYELYTELWWGAVHLLGYVVLPSLVIRFILRERVRDFGDAVSEGKVAADQARTAMLAALQRESTPDAPAEESAN